MDPKEFKRIIITSYISKIQQYHKYQVLWFFTFYTTIPHYKLKNRFATIIRRSFMEIADTNIWFLVAKDPILPWNILIKKSTLKMISLTFLVDTFSLSSEGGFSNR